MWYVLYLNLRGYDLTNTPQIKQLPLSFRTAKDLRGRAELLPHGPKWHAKPWNSPHPTKYPLTLYYRDPIDCLQSLLKSPLLVSQIELKPYRLYKDAEKLIRVYSEWMSGNAAWNMQVGLQVFFGYFLNANHAHSKGPNTCRCYAFGNDSILR
jgi:hypothetical protein